MCIFAPEDRIEPVNDPEAERLFQIGRAHDVNIRSDQPDSIPVELRGLEADRSAAKDHYAQAAERGHLSAMNNLSVYLHNGWGQGRGNYEPDFDAAFRWNVEMARRDDGRGFTGMASYLLSRDAGRHNPELGRKCLVEAAVRGDVPGSLALAELELKLTPDDAPIPVPEPARKRGIALLEDLGLREVGAAYDRLALFFDLKEQAPLKHEFYALEATRLGDPGGRIKLETLYGQDAGDAERSDFSACLQNLRGEDRANALSLCKRPGGSLTRAGADAPPAPSALMDLTMLRQIFAVE